METPLCTIVVVPRDRFSLSEASYESLCQHNPSNFPVIYVDSCHPKPWADRLDLLAAEGRITLIRTGCHLSQHEAYNLAIPHLRSKYVVFIDNDIMLTPGWVENLVACAEETGAAAVTPFVHEKEPGEDWRIHMCGAYGGIVEENGRLWFKDVHALQKEPLRDDFTRGRTGLVEYHAFLVRYETLQKTGPFDERCWHAMNHDDGSLMIRASGGEIWFEPTAVVKFVLPPPLAWQDVVFFINRWSGHRIESSIKYFSRKWGVEVSPDTAIWYHQFRQRIFLPLPLLLNRLFPGQLFGKIARRLLVLTDPMVSWVVEAWAHDPHREQRLEAQNPWRASGLDPATIKSFSEKFLRAPRSMQQELTNLADSVLSESS